MKGHDQGFVLLDPSIPTSRRKRIQFMLGEDEYALLEAAAVIQGTKVGDLAGRIFRKHILPVLKDEIYRLRSAAEPVSDPSETNVTPQHNDTVIRSPNTSRNDLAERPNADIVALLDTGVR